MKLLYKAADITEAHIIKGLLESHGITAHVGGFYLQGAVGDIPARDYVNVHVLDEDVPLAAEIIAKYEEAAHKPVEKPIPHKERGILYKLLLAVFMSIFTIIIITLVTND